MNKLSQQYCVNMFLSHNDNNVFLDVLNRRSKLGWTFFCKQHLWVVKTLKCHILMASSFPACERDRSRTRQRQTDTHICSSLYLQDKLQRDMYVFLLTITKKMKCCRPKRSMSSWQGLEHLERYVIAWIFYWSLSDKIWINIFNFIDM